MAGLMSRASLVVKSKFSKLLDRAEDPGRDARLLVREAARAAPERQARDRRRRDREEAAPAAGDAARSRASSSSTRRRARRWPPAARISRGRRSSASPACSSSCRGSTSRSQQLEQQQEKLVASEKRSRPRSRPSGRRRKSIKAQYSAAEAQVRIGEAATGIGEQMADTGLAIQRAKDKTEQMQARASRDRRADDVGHARGLHLRPDAARPRARRDRVAVAGRQGARADEGRARLAASEQEGADAVIVRIMGEGQFEIDDEVAKGLNELDEQAEQALEARRRGAARRAAGADGRARADERHAAPRRGPRRRRTAIVPPPDLTLEEARELFAGEGLIPDLPAA